MKKRSRQAAGLCKEPSSDLSDLDSDNPGGPDLPQKGKNQAAQASSKRAKPQNPAIKK